MKVRILRRFLAFDIGGTILKYGVLTEEGTFVEKYECLTEAYLGGPAILDKVKRLGRPSLISIRLAVFALARPAKWIRIKGRFYMPLPSFRIIQVPH